MYYYLISAVHAVNNIALKRIKISRFDNVNDPFELLCFDLNNRSNRKYIRNFKNKMNKTHSLICFSDNYQNPVQWSHYADSHKGIALGFEIIPDILTKVDYVSKLEKLDDKPIPMSNEELRSILIKTKFQDWKYEKESRLIVKLKENIEEGGLFFKKFGVDIKLKEVILGANCPIKLSAINELLELTNPNEKIKTIKARIAFSNYKVVTDKSKTNPTNKK